ncbi:MAG: hypothetical protein R3190_01875, partial [Thermoanaerobaculia bacterium]|nr:hypothetical protein [Thermoanaerobaculia bacterium]
VLRAPETYQPPGGADATKRRREAGTTWTRVASVYRLIGPDRVGFTIGPHDTERPLVVDPVLVYSTYLGGTSGGGFGDFGEGAAADNVGNAYFGGRIEGPTFPVTAGALQTACQDPDCEDGFIAKIDPTGALVFATYLGGDDADGILDVVVGAGGNVHFVGGSVSSDFPVTPGAFDITPDTVWGSAVVGTLGASGDAMVAATFVDGISGPAALAVDGAGNFYITGQTLSDVLVTTAGAFQDADPSPGLFDAFVAKISADATTAPYVTYLGSGDISDAAFAIDVDAGGHAYVAGFTNSLADFPTTPGVLQPLNAGGTCLCQDAFVTKLAADGGSLVYSTYLGGTGFDDVNALRVDASGNAWLVGSTDSADFPDVNALQPTLAGGSDAFLAVLNPTATALLSSTFLGGTANDSGGGLAFGGADSVWVAGATASTDFPTASPIQAANAGGSFDAFLAHIDTVTPALLFSTYLGGTGSDSARDIALSADSVVGIGLTSSTDLPVVNAVQPTYGGGTRDAFAFSIADVLVVEAAAPAALNPRSRSVVPVTILTTPVFDATDVDPATLRFGPGEAETAHPSGHVTDADGDGDFDLLLHFRIAETGIVCGDSEAQLTGETFGGEPLVATVAITTVGCGTPP